jgi:hypothetical protein
MRDLQQVGSGLQQQQLAVAGAFGWLDGTVLATAETLHCFLVLAMMLFLAGTGMLYCTRFPLHQHRHNLSMNVAVLGVGTLGMVLLVTTQVTGVMLLVTPLVSGGGRASLMVVRSRGMSSILRRNKEEGSI